MILAIHHICGAAAVIAAIIGAIVAVMINYGFIEIRLRTRAGLNGITTTSVFLEEFTILASFSDAAAGIHHILMIHRRRQGQASRTHTAGKTIATMVVFAQRAADLALRLFFLYALVIFIRVVFLWVGVVDKS